MMFFKDYIFLHLFWIDEIYFELIHSRPVGKIVILEGNHAGFMNNPFYRHNFFY